MSSCCTLSYCIFDYIYTCIYIYTYIHIYIYIYIIYIYTIYIYHAYTIYIYTSSYIHIYIYIYILICESFIKSLFMRKVFLENHLPWKLAAEPKRFHFFFTEKLEIVNESFTNNQEKPFITFLLTFCTIYGWECEFLLYM